MNKSGFVISILLFFSLVFTPLAVTAITAKDTVQTEVEKILEHLKDPSFKELPKDEQINQIRAIINTVFDYNELSRRTLGRDWKDFNPAQQDEFKKLFGHLLESNYADRVLAYTSQKIEFGKEIELNKDKVEVESTIITADNKSIPIHYRMSLKNEQWHVYDVVIEGISLVQNYRSQFREILSKDKPEVLLEKLRNKVNK